jgi:hypothetical protein
MVAHDAWFAPQPIEMKSVQNKKRRFVMKTHRLPVITSLALVALLFAIGVVSGDDLAQGRHDDVTNSTVAGNFSTVSGGEQNTANGDYSTVGGGQNNRAIGQFITIGGGTGNEVSHGLLRSVEAQATTSVALAFSPPLPGAGATRPAANSPSLVEGV